MPATFRQHVGGDDTERTQVKITQEIRHRDPNEKPPQLPCAADVFGMCELKQLSFPVAPPYTLCNPCIHFDQAHGIRRAAVRAVDYRLDTIAPDGSDTRNYIVELDQHLDILHVAELEDASDYPKNPDARVRGFEDLRLFSGRDSISGQPGLNALATACDLAGGGMRPEIVRLDLERRSATYGSEKPSYRITKCIPLRGPWNYMPQKNWMPVDDGIGNRFLYRVVPRMTFLYKRGRLTIETDQAFAGFAPSSLRGSSQAIPWREKWLAVVHEHVSTKPMVYAHRIVLLDHELEIKQATPAFSWTGDPVEFCAGLATDGRRVIASFGKHDKEAWLAAIDVDDVIGQLTDV